LIYKDIFYFNKTNLVNKISSGIKKREHSSRFLKFFLLKFKRIVFAATKYKVTRSYRWPLQAHTDPIYDFRQRGL